MTSHVTVRAEVSKLCFQSGARLSSKFRCRFVAAAARHQASSKNKLIEKEQGFDMLSPNRSGRPPQEVKK